MLLHELFRGLSIAPDADSAGLSRRRLMVGVVSAWALAGCRGDPAPTPSARAGLSQAELLQADQRGQLCTAANAKGVGLQGEYFQKPGGSGVVLLKRLDATIDFDSGLEWPADLAGQRPRSVRWSGWIKPPLSGAYRLHAPAATRAKLFVANLEFDGPAAADAPIELAAGRFYPVRIEVDLQEQSPADRLRLEWTAPHGARYVVPRPLLFQPTETVRPAGS